MMAAVVFVLAFIGGAIGGAWGAYMAFWLRAREHDDA